MNNLQFLLIIYFASTICISQDLDCSNYATMDEEMAIVKTYLKQYGYLEENVTSADSEEMMQAIKLFQRSMQIEETGNLTADVLNLMLKPRCGVQDLKNKLEEQNITKWDKSHLKYKIDNYPKSVLQKTVVREEIKMAFEMWSQVTNISFEEVEKDYDIRIYFNTVFKIACQTAAYAAFPPEGVIRFNPLSWTAHTLENYNLRYVAAHEIGHALGLRHNMHNKSAVMYFMYPDILYLEKLHTDDIRDIKKLYGERHRALFSQRCDLTNIDAAIYDYRDHLYILKNDKVWKFQDRKIVYPYPRLISEEWKGLESNIDAAVFFDSSYYFFKGKKTWSFNGTLYERTLHDIQRTIDAAFVRGNLIYFFVERHIVKFQYKNKQWNRLNDTRRNDRHYFRIYDSFVEMPNDIDAAYYDRKDNLYIFKGETIYINDIRKHTTTKSSIFEWFGCKKE